MKRLILSCIIVALAIVARAQDEVKLADIVRPGTQLVYQIKANGKKYLFTVTVNDLQGSSFGWQMGEPVNKSGSVMQSAKALQTGNVLYNHFSAGAAKLDDRSTSVWLSRAVARHFNTAAGKPIALYAYGRDAAPLQIGTFTGDIPVEIKVDGVAKLLTVGLAKPLKKAGHEYIAAATDEYIHYNPDLKLPLIVNMQLDFSITLEEVITK